MDSFMTRTDSTIKTKDEGTKKFEDILSGTTSFIYVVDRDHRIEYVSPVALKAMKMPLADIIGKRFGELGIQFYSSVDYEGVISEAFKTGNVQHNEVTYPEPKRKLYFAVDAVPLKNDGGVDRIVLTARDITSRKVTENLSGTLNRIYAAINSTMSFQEIMRRMVEISSTAIDSEATAVALLEGDKWVLRYTHGSIPSNAVGASFTDEQMRSCFLSSEGCVSGVVDIRKVDWISKKMMEKFKILSFMSVPLNVKSRIIGVLIFAFTIPREFSSEEMDFATKLSTAISLALENSNLYRQERNRRLIMQTILDDLPAVIIDLDGKDLTIKWANRYSNRYRFGSLSEKSTIGMSLESIFPKEAQSAVLDMFKMVAKTGRPFYNNEFMLAGLGDHVIYWSGALVPLIMDDEKIPDLLILAVDITDQVNARKKSEELARLAEEERKHLQTVLDTLPVGAALLDRSGRIIYLNPTATGFWNAILPSFNDVRDLDDVQAWNTNTGESLQLEDWGMVKSLFEGKPTLNEMVTLKRYDNREMIMTMSSSPLLDAHAGVIGAIVIGQDISNQVQMQRELMESKTRSELYVDLLTHDISNLNAAAMGYLQLLQSIEELSEKASGWAGHALESLDESTRLIDSVRGIQSIEVGNEDLKAVDIVEVLSKVAAEHGRYPGREVDISLSSVGSHCVLANQLVVEIFSNLIDNAIRHSSGPINVWIRVSTVFESGREYHRIDIEDNGPGIPDQVKEQIFTRAWRGRTKAVGKGLGLFLVRRLVEDFDGRVWVEDRIIGDPTKGSRFVVLLPTAECAT
jgi:PAS domain S-box-containing protein